MALSGFTIRYVSSVSDSETQVRPRGVGLGIYDLVIARVSLHDEKVELISAIIRPWESNHHVLVLGGYETRETRRPVDLSEIF